MDPLPRQPPSGRPGEHRQILNGIPQDQRAGAPRPVGTVPNRFRRWRGGGVQGRVLAAGRGARPGGEVRSLARGSAAPVRRKGTRWSTGPFEGQIGPWKGRAGPVPGAGRRYLRVLPRPSRVSGQGRRGPFLATARAGGMPTHPLSRRPQRLCFRRLGDDQASARPSSGSTCPLRRTKVPVGRQPAGATPAHKAKSRRFRHPHRHVPRHAGRRAPRALRHARADPGRRLRPARVAPEARNPNPTGPRRGGPHRHVVHPPGRQDGLGPPPAGCRVRAAPARARPAPGSGPVPRRAGGRGPGDGRADRRRPRPGSGPPGGGAAGPREAARGRHPRAGAGAPRGAPRRAGGGAGRGGTTGNPREGTVRAFEGATGQAGRFVEVAVPAIPVRAPEEPPPRPGRRARRPAGPDRGPHRGVDPERRAGRARGLRGGGRAARVAVVVWFSNRVPSVNPSLRSPHPSLARHHPTDPVSGPAIVLSRFEGACAGPMVLSAVGTRPPHDGSSSESAFQCGSRGPRAAATKPTEWPHPRPGRDPSTRPKDGREPMSGSSRAGPPIPRPDDVRPSCSAPGRRPLPSSASRA